MVHIVLSRALVGTEKIPATYVRALGRVWVRILYVKAQELAMENPRRDSSSNVSKLNWNLDMLVFEER